MLSSTRSKFLRFIGQVCQAFRPRLSVSCLVFFVFDQAIVWYQENSFLFDRLLCVDDMQFTTYGGIDPEVMVSCTPSFLGYEDLHS